MLKKIRPLVALFALSTLNQTYADDLPWKTNEAFASLTKINLGSWEFTDDTPADDRWVDNAGNKDSHSYPACYLLDIPGETGKGYVVKDIAKMFDNDGILRDNRDNLDRLMSSPLMTSANLVYTASGGPVDVDFMFGAGDFGNRLCYYYIPKDAAVDQETRSMVKAFTDNEVPTFCITDQMRASKHMERYEKDSDGNWIKLDKNEVEFRNDYLGVVLAAGPDGNYAGWGDCLVTGKKFRLKYFGPAYDQAPTDEFPEGTRIYFFLLTYNDGNWDGDLREPYSVKFASRELNREFGKQGNWDKTNDRLRAYAEKYGEGVIASAAVNFTYVDSDKGTLEGINMMTWEDWTQPTDNVGDFDMGDVAFGLYGVKNPILDAGSDSSVDLKVVQEVRDYKDNNPYNNYRFRYILSNDDKAPVLSRSLQPVTFADGRFQPGYTWATIRRFADDSEVGEIVRYLCVKKSAHMPDESDDIIDNLDSPELVYRLEYGFSDSLDEIPTTWEKWSGATSTDYHEYVRGANGDDTPVPFDKMTGIYCDMRENIVEGDDYVDVNRFVVNFSLANSHLLTTNYDAVASPRGQIVVEPRGTAASIDLADSDVKHVASADALAEIDNRTYVTLTYNPQVELYGKEHISALFILNREGWRFGKIYQNDNGEWVTTAENTSNPENKNADFKIVSIVDESETCRKVLVSTNLSPDNRYAMMIETRRDVKAPADGFGDWNTFGLYHEACAMPELEFTQADIQGLGQRPADDAKAPYVFNVSTKWQLTGHENAEEILFSQWRGYNLPANPWNYNEGALLNILHNSEAKTGTILESDYNAWIKESFNNEDNVLVADGNEWTNRDVLAQVYDGSSEVNASYVVRAYLKAKPALLNQATPANVPASRANQQVIAADAQGAADAGYIVLEATKSATAQQTATTSIDSIDADDAEAVYYNLQGLRVDKPAAGQVYIVVKGTSATKVVF